ncbi:MAG TPA: hypothetical protein VGH90_06495 [Chthoniobacteraceae bacterium]|jgi:hypothetical protein
MANAKSTNPLEEISKLQAQIAQLKDVALQELKMRKTTLETEISSIDREVEKISGRPAGRRGVKLFDTPARRSVTFHELRDLLLAEPDRTLSVRKAGLDSTNIRTLANLNPRELRLGGKGPWPTVTLVK